MSRRAGRMCPVMFAGAIWKGVGFAELRLEVVVFGVVSCP